MVIFLRVLQIVQDKSPLMPALFRWSVSSVTSLDSTVPVLSWTADEQELLKMHVEYSQFPVWIFRPMFNPFFHVSK